MLESGHDPEDRVDDTAFLLLFLEIYPIVQLSFCQDRAGGGHGCTYARALDIAFGRTAFQSELLWRY